MGRPINRRKTRLPVHGNRGFWLRELRSRSAEEYTDFTQFLASINIRVISVDDNGVSRWRIARFGDLSLIQAGVSRSEARWERDHHSIDRVVIIIGDFDTIRVEGTNIVSREPGVFIVPPGDDPVEMHFDATVNEFLVGSIPSNLLADVELPARGERFARPIDAVLLGFLREFLLAQLQRPPKNADWHQARHAVADVFRTVLRLAAQGIASQRPLYDRVIREMMLDLSNPDLGAEYLAHELGVSERHLQLEFQRRGTTVQRELRRLRAAGALRAKRENPGVDPQMLARIYGFGSTSTLYRAMAEERQRALQASAPNPTNQ